MDDLVVRVPGLLELLESPSWAVGSSFTPLHETIGHSARPCLRSQVSPRKWSLDWNDGHLSMIAPPRCPIIRSDTLNSLLGSYVGFTGIVMSHASSPLHSCTYTALGVL